ncbi:hypothetical protein GTO27_12195 [Candidatus Bathyarchaeota archaeon]|nr:hypothetical protein [Candidatus Bathyarchaeota archaeon]
MACAQARKADADLARGHIKGPLHGVPITIKDNIETAGMICTGGTKGARFFRANAGCNYRDKSADRRGAHLR